MYDIDGVIIISSNPYLVSILTQSEWGSTGFSIETHGVYNILINQINIALILRSKLKKKKVSVHDFMLTVSLFLHIHKFNIYIVFHSVENVMLTMSLCRKSHKKQTKQR